ncbi:MAG: alpha/beta hydrolase family protein [Phycisphaerales bacterium]
MPLHFRIRPLALLASLLAATISLASTARAAQLDERWVGAWMGTVASPDAGVTQLTMPVTVVVRKGISAEAGAESAPIVEVTILRAGALAKTAADVVADGASLAFTLDSQGRRARFEGTLEAPADAEKDADPTVKGTFVFLLPDGGRSEPAFLWSMRRVDLVRDLPNATVYAAALDAGGQKLPMRLALAEGPRGLAASMEVASQGLLDLAVEVDRTATGYTVRLPAGAVATIELESKDDGAVLEGTFTQGAFNGPIRFERTPAARLTSQRRPQDPVPPFPYANSEVEIAHPAGHALGGTLSIPSDSPLAREGRVPAVVLVTGSGPQNRDEELLGHRPFAVIADALARAGVAVLRYDDRGVGASTGTFAGATTLDLASDADIASEWLKRQPGIDPARVGMIGHSEGAMIVPIVAMWQNEGDAPVHPLAFGVAMAMPAESGGATLTRQPGAMFRAAGADERKIEAAIAAHRAVMEAVAANATAEEKQVLVAGMVRTQLAASGASLSDIEMAAAISNAYAQITDPWMAAFIAFDPAPVLTRGEIPMLAIFGGKDVQGDAETNAFLYGQLATKGGAKVLARVYPDANHLFQIAGTGMPDEYGAIETTIEPAILADIVEFVVSSARSAPHAQIPEASRPEGWNAGEAPKRLWLYEPKEKPE